MTRKQTSRNSLETVIDLDKELIVETNAQELSEEDMVFEAHARSVAGDYLGLLNVDTPRADQTKEEQELVDVARGLVNAATWALITEGLIERARMRHPAFQKLDRATQVRIKLDQELIDQAPLSFDSRHYVEEAPTLSDLLFDETRTKQFIYNDRPAHQEADGTCEEVMTEAEGLYELSDYLAMFVEKTKGLGDGNRYSELTKIAQSMLDDLTFIGDREYRQASRAIGEYWKDYLSGDPERKICVITGISNSKKYPGLRKSDVHFKEQILKTFSGTDVAQLSPRILDDIEQLRGHDPEKTKIVLLDDWSISGTQINRVFNMLYDFFRGAGYDDSMNHQFINSIEANFIVASKRRLEHGITDPDRKARMPLKTKAYYVSRFAGLSTSGNESHVTGLHSTVNYDFAEPIWKMAKVLNDKLGLGVETPALAQIVRSYRRGE